MTTTADSRKQAIELIKQVAAQMPVILENTHEVHMVKGAELIEQGHTHEEVDKGKLVDPEKTYVQKMPVQIQVNHKRRMLRAYVRGGNEAVLKYIGGISKLIKSQQKPTDERRKRKGFKFWKTGQAKG